MSWLGAIGAGLTVGLRRGNVLLSLIVLPLAMPLLIFGAGATDRAMSGIEPGGGAVFSGRAVRVHVYPGAFRGGGGAAHHAGVNENRLCGLGFIGWHRRRTCTVLAAAAAAVVRSRPAAICIGYGLIGGLAFAPPDYQQGDAFRIIYVHAPSRLDCRCSPTPRWRWRAASG